MSESTSEQAAGRPKVTNAIIETCVYFSTSIGGYYKYVNTGSCLFRYVPNLTDWVEVKDFSERENCLVQLNDFLLKNNPMLFKRLAAIEQSAKLGE